LIHGQLSEDADITEAIDALPSYVHRGGFVFAPFVSSKNHLSGRLSVTIFRPAPVGEIVHGGDIDNRIKTLFDSLCVPPHENQLKGIVPEDGDLFFTVFEDDRLIRGLSVDLDLLLDTQDPNEVLLVIHVDTSILKTTFANIGL
jgi:hypothetical protein